MSMFPLHTVGGSNTYALEIVRNLAAMGNDVGLVVPKPISSGNIASLEGVQIIGLPTLRYPFLSAPTFWLQSRLLASKILKRGPFDIIHYNDVSGALHPSGGLPSVVTIHHSAKALQHYLPSENLLWAKEFRVQQGFMPAIERQVIAKANRVIAVSELTKSTVVGFFGIDPKLVDVVYNGVSNDFLFPQGLNEIKRTKAPYRDRFVFLYVGRPERRKGINVLLKVLKTAAAMHPRILLLVVGPGNWGQYYRYVRESGLSDHVAFRGRVARDELIRLYQMCDVVVLPSYLEGFGLSVIEGMASGKPVIAPQWSGVREIVLEAKGGFIVDPTKPDTLLNAIIKMVENEDVAKTMGEHNRDSIAHLTWENAARKTLEVYSKCLS